MNRATPDGSQRRAASYITPESSRSGGLRRNRQSESVESDDSGPLFVPEANEPFGPSILGKRRQRQVQNASIDVSTQRPRSEGRWSHIPSDSQGRVSSQGRFGRLRPGKRIKTESDDLAAFNAPISLPACGHNREISDEDLDNDQKAVIDMAVVHRKNLCIVGQAGTGKSTLINALKGNFHDRGIHARVVAPTGTAALNVHGSTIHSFAGLGCELNRGIEYYENLSSDVLEKLQSTETLIMDEVSMVPNEQFKRLDRVMKKAHGSGDPFGGVQVIVVGDFCQLPPVKPFQHCFECGMKRISYKSGTFECRVHGTVYTRDQWAFRAPVWDELSFEYILLKQRHRQDSNHEFLEILDRQWRGLPFTRAQKILLLDHPCEVENAVELVTHHSQREKINERHYGMLPGEEVEYVCRDDFEHNRRAHPELGDLRKRLKDGTLAALLGHRYESNAYLKLGMPVILLNNMNVGQGLVNGSQGVVVGFRDYNEKELPRPQIRTASFGGLQSTRLIAIRQDRILEFMSGNHFPPLPVVKFNSNPDNIVIWPDCSISERGFTEPYSLLIRTQLPLMAGWALTIHKAQGMTLDRTVVDLSNNFAFGQIYVALSRVRGLRNLQVKALGDGAAGFAMCDEVKAFLEAKFGIDFGPGGSSD
ncbi:hypothetical protein Q7P37_010834 [Cladosporium fusiforme]